MAIIDKIALKNDQGVQIEYDIEDSTARRLATTSQTGQVKPDGTTVTIDADGTIHSAGGSSGISITATLLAASWNAQNQQTITFTGYQANMNGVIGVPASATDAQKEAYASALVRTVAQNGNQFTFECESIPSIDLPVTIYAGGSSGGSGVPVGGTINQALLKNSNTDGDTKWANVVMPGDIAPTESTSTSSKAYAVGELFYYEGVLYKVTSTIAQGDSIVTSGSGKNVEVTTVDVEFGTRDDELAAITNVYGSKNLLENKGVSQTINGVTFTVNSDGSITVSGTATGGNAIFPVSSAVYGFSKNPFPSGNMILSGCPEGGAPGNATYSFWYRGSNDGTTDVYNNAEYGNGVTVPYYPYINVYIRVQNGYEFPSPMTFYPMLRDARIVDGTYEPYAKTNRQLTEDAAQLPAMQEAGAVNLLYNETISQTVNGLTFTVNADKSVTVNGTATANTAIQLERLETDAINERFKRNTPYILGGCPAGGSGSTYYMRVEGIIDGVTTWYTADYGNGGTFTLLDSKSYTVFKPLIQIISGYTANNLTFKPMLYDACLVNPPYQPFTMTNRELTDKQNATDVTLSKCMKERYLVWRWNNAKFTLPENFANGILFGNRNGKGMLILLSAINNNVVDVKNDFGTTVTRGANWIQLTAAAAGTTEGSACNCTLMYTTDTNYHEAD